MAESRIAKINRAIARNEGIRSLILGTGADELAGIFISAENEIFGKLLDAMAGSRITPMRAEVLISEIDQIIRQELRIPGTLWVERNAPVIYNLGIEQGARSAAARAGVGSFDAIPTEKVRQTFLTFAEGPEYGAILNEGFKTWLGEVGKTSDLMIQNIRRQLTQGAISGATNKQIVENLLTEGQFKGLVRSDGAKISAADRAKTLVRTEGQRSINQAEIAVDAAAGFDAWISVGVADERRSAICEVAQRQPPHTIGWWISSVLGLAPRHVANCRDEMMAIDLATFTNNDARTLGIRGYNQATYFLDSGRATASENRKLKREIQRAEARMSRTTSLAGRK